MAGRVVLVLRYAAVAAAAGVGALLLLQLLLGRNLERLRIRQLAAPVAQTSRLAELALERLPPMGVAEFSGLPIRISPPAGPPSPQAEALAADLCRRLDPCPRVRSAATGGPRGLWVELQSPLEPAWLFVPLPAARLSPPDPLLLALAIVAAGLITTLTALAVEVQRPLALLERGLARVGVEDRPTAIQERGRGAVRRLARHFNAMLERLERTAQERATMLAGIAHDLNSPLTRLRLRLSMPEGRHTLSPEDRAKAQGDLDAMARMLRQFLHFAGAAEEPALTVPLDQVLAELSASHGSPGALELALEPMERTVRVTALQRAVANLIDNAHSHGRAPWRLVLRSDHDAGFTIEMWDGGSGIPPERWGRALQPFQRLDPARGGLGHCGLGLAIAARVAAAHHGALHWRRGEQGQGFAVCISGRSLLAAAPVRSGHTPAG